MFKVKATQHVLAVKDIETTESYFLDKLGFSVRFRVNGWSFLSLGDFHIMLGHCPDEVPARDINEHSYFAYVNCECVDDLYRDYQKRGLIFFSQWRTSPGGCVSLV